MKTNTRFWYHSLLSGVFIVFLALAGCSGDDGAPGQDGQDVDPATVDDLQSQIDALKLGNVESCSVCHSDDGGIVLSGAGHQAAYDELYQDQALTVTNLAYTYDGVGDNDVVTFTMQLNGVDFDCTQAEAVTINFAQYDSVTREFSDGATSGFWRTIGNSGTLSYLGGGNCSSTNASGLSVDLNTLDGVIVAYGRDETVTSIPAAHISIAKYPFATMIRTGAASVYTSLANSSACEGCHTQPFLKHAYIYGEVNDGTNNDGNDFHVCKTCHLDQRPGGHEDWQILKDDPARYAEIAAGDPLTPAEEAKYAYKTRLMNDVHMSHAMEFPYPQEMFNCATCHDGKLDPAAGGVLADANFQAETCISCHSVDGLVDKMTTSRAGNPITIHANYIVDSDTLKATNCSLACHTTGGFAPVLSSIHNGYNPEIYADAAGTKYADEVTVSIDDTTSFDAATNILTVNFDADAGALAGSVDVATIVPTVVIGLYGYNTKDFIVAAHGRDADRNRLLEYPVDGVTVNPRFTTVTAAGGVWSITADLSMWADMIADGTIKRAEIAVMPALDDANGDTVGLNAPSRTFDLTANAFDDAYFGDIVKVADGCNNCHDQLATTFHSGNRGGNIRVCRLCHVKSSGGSHLEMQSRSIDSYVHAVHSFQVFDIDEVDFTDPVEALEYEHHIGTLYPKFGIENCESCHTTGTYGVPDQSKSMPALLSDSETVTGWDRNIGYVPAVVTGPAATACGGCHRAVLINEDDAGGLAALNAHTKSFGYAVEDDDGVWDAVVEAVMSLF